MNIRFVVLFTLAILGGSSAVCTWKTWRKWPHCIWNRDVTQSTQSGTEELFDVILGLVNKAPEGILSSELADTSQKVKELSDALAGSASEEDVASVIKEVTDTLGGDTVISALFDDDLRYGDKIMNKGLSLLKGLVDKGRELKASGKAIDHVLVAISKTASALNATVKNIVDIAEYEKSGTQEPVKAGNGSDDVLIFADDQQPKSNNDDTSDGVKQSRSFKICLRWLLWWKICAEWS
ncbi:unnamed protein product [Lymnaea stagnalis]|uniref:Uncharacterized protein n=1 Tax=Lymnaea stagnalis TaxID=6523 RepID=A0AAV2I6P5_LYMST